MSKSMNTLKVGLVAAVTVGAGYSVVKSIGATENTLDIVSLNHENYYDIGNDQQLVFDTHGTSLLLKLAKAPVKATVSDGHESVNVSENLSAAIETRVGEVTFSDLECNMGGPITADITYQLGQTVFRAAHQDKHNGSDVLVELELQPGDRSHEFTADDVVMGSCNPLSKFAVDHSNNQHVLKINDQMYPVLP
jgi:hypothetical protein